MTVAENAMTFANKLSTPLVARTDLYLQAHLSDRTLCADRVAAAQNISRRYLYPLLPQRERSLEQLIIHIRLEQARRELGGQHTHDRTIAAIASRAGLAHPQFFSRRFREA